MKVVGMIPARMESSRLPKKALIDIMGLPMVVHTCKRAQLSKKLDEVYLVTDSQIIKETGQAHNIKVIMTSSSHKTGSDRLAEACQKIDCDIVVNIQGDEVLVNPEHIDMIIAPMLSDSSIQLSVGVTPYAKKNSASDIKAVLDMDDNIMYCSRNDLPSNARTTVKEMLKMCFIVPFRKEFLLRFTSWQPTPLESIEYNEYLRVLEHGVKIKAVRIKDAKISVDTPADLEEARRLMVIDKVRNRYMSKKVL